MLHCSVRVEVAAVCSGGVRYRRYYSTYSRREITIDCTKVLAAVSERYLLMLFIFLMCMLTDQQMLVICFWRVILLSNVTISILTYSLTSILSLPTTRHWLSPRLFFVLKITNSVLSSLSFNALRRIQSQMSKIQLSS